MSEPNPEWLILAIVLISLALAPLASKLVRDVGNKVSSEVGGPDDDGDDPAVREDEIAQMMEARAYVRSRRTGEEQEETPPPPPAAPAQDDELREEVRQVVIAGNERRERRGEAPLDVEAETDRRLAALRNP